MFGSTSSQRVREVPLYSFGDIVAAVGGSLGLFLGFSCLGTGWRAVEEGIERFRRGRGRGEKEQEKQPSVFPII